MLKWKQTLKGLMRFDLALQLLCEHACVSYAGMCVFVQ